MDRRCVPPARLKEWHADRPLCHSLPLPSIAHGLWPFGNSIANRIFRHHHGRDLNCAKTEIGILVDAQNALRLCNLHETRRTRAIKLDGLYRLYSNNYREPEVLAGPKQ